MYQISPSRRITHLTGRLLSLVAICVCWHTGSVAQQPGEIQKQIGKQLQQQNPAAAKFQVKPLGSVGGFSEWVLSVALSPDGKTVAVGAYEEIQLIDVATRKQTKKIRMRNGYVRSLAFSPNGKQLAAGGYQITILWDPATGKRIRKLEDHFGYVTALVYSKDGKRLISSSEDQTVRITNPETGKEILVMKDFEYPVHGVALSPDEKLLATASGDKDFVIKHGHVKLWNAATGELVAKLEDHERAASGVAFSADGKLLVSTSDDEKANVYDVEKQKPLGFYKGHERPTNCALWAVPNIVVSGGGGRAQKKNDVKIWDRRDGMELATLSGHQGRVTSITLGADGKMLISGSYDGRIIFWDISAVIKDPEATKKYLDEQEKKKKAAKQKK